MAVTKRGNSDFPYNTDPKWKLYTLFIWITVLLVYMSF